ncbi:hypothetical protein AQUCO_01400800v1 [Aquilegia coerulea]|uniref:Uncharacterized protein n=1 Tax=Aquilegia coerulea TaxID=218851 RepID=A0A2G5DY75_AQUCA|nr:hypothetical protein AQUCO_01400800v1 [Aquilegia coerulea]
MSFWLKSCCLFPAGPRFRVAAAGFTVFTAAGFFLPLFFPSFGAAAITSSISSLSGILSSGMVSSKSMAAVRYDQNQLKALYVTVSCKP